MQRKNGSRSEELNFISSFLSSSESFHSFIRRNPIGGTYNESNITIIYGNITRLISDLELTRYSLLPNIKPIIIYHLDHLKSDLKKLIELKHSLHAGAVCSEKAKADILIITKDKPYYISFKDITKEAKLGQFSSHLQLGQVKLEGGLKKFIEIPAAKIIHTNSNLTFEQFNKLNSGNKKWAVYKSLYDKDFQRLVDQMMENAYAQLYTFCHELTKDIDLLLEFLTRTLVGNSESVLDDFYLVMGDSFIHVKSVLNKIKKLNPEICTQEFISRNSKKSMLLSIRIKDKKYWITKIEPSFDGSRKNVSQTKGIIYYFQEFSDNVNQSYKSLLIDVSENKFG
ncbi:MAG: hypothetical protein HQ474_11690 [Flammeovirgaceae bacterium]|nr:hypothetical protein [Flammeovirgaceae bacterium]